jgi:hypothetical protein
MFPKDVTLWDTVGCNPPGLQCWKLGLGDTRMMSASLFPQLPICRIFWLWWAGMAQFFALHLYLRLEVFGQCSYPVTECFRNPPPSVSYHYKNLWQVSMCLSFSSGVICQGTQLVDALWNCSALWRIQFAAPWVMSNVASVILDKPFFNLPTPFVHLLQR